MSDEIVLHKSAVLLAIKNSAAMTEMIDDARKALLPFKQGLSGDIVRLDFPNKDGCDHSAWCAEAKSLLNKAYCVLVDIEAALSPREVEV